MKNKAKISHLVAIIDLSAKPDAETGKGTENALQKRRRSTKASKE
jgi:hypothetical protein